VEPASLEESSTFSPPHSPWGLLDVASQSQAQSTPPWSPCHQRGSLSPTPPSPAEREVSNGQFDHPDVQASLRPSSPLSPVPHVFVLHIDRTASQEEAYAAGFKKWIREFNVANNLHLDESLQPQWQPQYKDPELQTAETSIHEVSDDIYKQFLLSIYHLSHGQPISPLHGPHHTSPGVSSPQPMHKLGSPQLTPLGRRRLAKRHNTRTPQDRALEKVVKLSTQIDAITSLRASLIRQRTRQLAIAHLCELD